MFKHIKVVISTMEAEFGEALARGIAETGENFLIETTKTNPTILSDDEVLITEIMPENLSEERVIVLPRGAVSVERLLEAIYNKASALGFSRVSRHGGCSLLGIYSLEGGCGVTVIAVTLGRMFAAHYGRRVLYVDVTGGEDYRIYSGADYSRVKPKKELFYRLKKGLTANVDSFTAKDIYGLRYLNCDKEEIGEELEKLKETGNFDLIILDFGKLKEGNIADSCSFTLAVMNEKDRRTKYNEKMMDNLQVINFCQSNDKLDNIIRIAEDDESFVLGDDGVEIVMGKYFSIGVKQLAEVIEGEL